MSARCASSQAIAAMSRWLVGSSSSIRSGASARILASAARRRSPPEARAGSSAGSSFSPSIAVADPPLLAGGERLAGEGAEGGESGEVRVLRHVADARPGRTKRLPASGSTSPAISFISVDLPEPLRPTSAIRSPGWTASRHVREERVAAEGQPRCRRGSGSGARPWRSAYGRRAGSVKTRSRCNRRRRACGRRRGASTLAPRRPADDPVQPADPRDRAAAGDGGPPLARRRRLPARAAADQPQPGRAGRAAARAPARGDGRDGARRGRHPPLRPGARPPGAALRDRLALERPLRRRDPPRRGGDHRRLQPGLLHRDHHPRRPRRRGDAAGALVLQPQDVARHDRHRGDPAALRPRHAARPGRGPRPDDPAGPRHRAGHPEQPDRRGVPARARSPSSPSSPASTARC